jgi:hypothetical protein
MESKGNGEAASVYSVYIAVVEVCPRVNNCSGSGNASLHPSHWHMSESGGEAEVMVLWSWLLKVWTGECSSERYSCSMLCPVLSIYPICLQYSTESRLDGLPELDAAPQPDGLQRCLKLDEYDS